MEEIFSREEEVQETKRMHDVFDMIIDGSSILEKSRESSDIDSTKELAVIKLIDSDDITKDILKALEGTEERKKLEQFFPVRKETESIFERKGVIPSPTRRLLLAEATKLDEKGKPVLSENETNFVLIHLDKNSENIYRVAGGESLSVFGNVADKCKEIVKTEEYKLEKITEQLVKNTY